MTHRTKAHLSMLWLIPCIVGFAPIGILLVGLLGYFENVTFGISEEYRWAKLCDDYDEKVRTSERTS